MEKSEELTAVQAAGLVSDEWIKKHIPSTQNLADSGVMKYKESEYVEQLLAYIRKTYSEHYNTPDNVQFMDVIMADEKDGLGFLKHSVSKYALRYGKKDGYNRKDLMKAMHYLLLLMYKSDKLGV